jgi:phthiodiolone/phenolphthiodiolone dimycocerosates ketoreductase
VVREVFLSGTPDEVIDQAAQWRDQGARHIVLADVSSLQRTLRNGLAATISFGKILRGLKNYNQSSAIAGELSSGTVLSR